MFNYSAPDLGQYFWKHCNEKHSFHETYTAIKSLSVNNVIISTWLIKIFPEYILPMKLIQTFSALLPTDIKII